MRLEESQHSRLVRVSGCLQVAVMNLLCAWPLLLAFFSQTAHACAVCGGFGKDDPSRWAFLLTFAIMTAVPLLLFAAFLLYLRKRMREQALDNEQEQEDRA